MSLVWPFAVLFTIAVMIVVPFTQPHFSARYLARSLGLILPLAALGTLVGVRIAGRTGSDRTAFLCSSGYILAMLAAGLDRGSAIRLDGPQELDLTRPEIHSPNVARHVVFHVEQVDEEIIGQRLAVLGEDAVFRPSDIAGDPNAKLWANPKNSS
jgi:hypothetical protein